MNKKEGEPKDLPISDPSILRQIAAGLRMSTGQISGITNCVLGEDNVFRGVFHQRINPTKTKSFAFSYGEDLITFKPIGGEQNNDGSTEQEHIQSRQSISSLRVETDRKI